MTAAEAKVGVPFEAYAADEAANWTSLKNLRDSPLAYRYFRDHPEADKDTVGRQLGRTLHTLVFEPHKFEAEYAIFDGDRRGTNEYKAFVAANPGRTIVKASEIADVQAQAAAIREHPALAPYLDGGLFEVSLRWRDQATGLPCKGRVDWWHPASRTLIDLKGTNTIHPHYFGRICARLGYHCQLGHYSNGIKAVTGFEPAKVAILAAHTKAPYDCGLFVLSEDDLYAGQEEVAGLLAKLAECHASGRWPGAHPTETPLTLPPYIWGDSEDPSELGVDFAS